MIMCCTDISKNWSKHIFLRRDLITKFEKVYASIIKYKMKCNVKAVLKKI